MSWYFLLPLLVLLVVTLLLGTVVVLGRWRGGRYLRAIVTRVPMVCIFFIALARSGFDRSSAAIDIRLNTRCRNGTRVTIARR